MSEIIAALFAIDFYIQYRLNKEEEFWDTSRKLEIISNIGIIIFSNILFLIKADFRDDEVLGPFGIFLIWTTFCFLKFIKIHLIMMGLIQYKIIVKTCFDVFPIVIDLIKIYALVIIFYATFGLFLFGGVLCTNFTDIYYSMTKDELDEQVLTHNFNDSLNSMIFFLNMNMKGHMSFIQICLIAYKSNNPQSEFGLFVLKMFFYSYLIITEFIILNVIVGFICDFIGMYQNNLKEIQAEQDEIKRNQTLIDLMLDKERKDGDARSDIGDNFDPPKKEKVEEKKEDLIEKDSIEDDSLLKNLSDNSDDENAV
jgi:hypothetical protein